MVLTRVHAVLLASLTFCIFVQAQKCNPSDDPCFSWMHVPIPQQDTRHPSIVWQPNIHDQCDVFSLSSDVWYKSDYNMTTACPGLGNCATKYPIWLNGSNPSASDGIVRRQACVNNFDGCCDRVYNVSVRHCIFYTVFCFDGIRPSCPQRFCLDVDLSKVTTTFPTTTTTTTTKQLTFTTAAVTGSSENKANWCNKEAVISLAVCLVIAMVVVLAMVVAVYQLKTKNHSVGIPAKPMTY